MTHFMLPLILILGLFLNAAPVWADPPWHDATVLPITGELTFYGAGAMEWAYEHRLQRGQVPVCDPPQCVGYVATLRPGDLGRKVWLQAEGRAAEGPFLVVDYAAQKDYERLRARGLIAEIDNKTARRWGMIVPLQNVRMMAESPYTESIHLPLAAVAGARYRVEGTMRGGAISHLWMPLLLSD
ncbi:MAG: hypothetical protein U9R25_10175 [Chloroflexota bacterium]|nr:hypothetical protein [Chloroflexota bacterium]